ncbi:MAG: aldo/keto reductase [Gaiellaceae bacterium]|jgi:aryl-alcohol dehydrogenase-like predicted oxidoreductase
MVMPATGGLPRPSMHYGRIRGVEKTVSRVVMGTFTLTTPDSAVLCDEFVARGGNCFDTAHIYNEGVSETILGRWIASRKLREQAVILGKGAHTPFCTPADVAWQLAESLERLQTDYIDLYMLHRDNLDVPVGEFITVLNAHRDAGHIRAFGASNWSIRRIEEAQEYARLHGLAGFSAVSNQFSLARMIEPPVEGCVSAWDAASRDWLTRTQIALMPWSSQAAGFFTGCVRPDDGSDPEFARSWHSTENFARLERATETALRRGVPTIAVALAYVLCQPFPTFPLIGPRSLIELDTSLLGLDVPLTESECLWLEGELDTENAFVPE